MKDINSSSHSKWRCKHHIVFAPKYRRLAIYGETKRDVGRILGGVARTAKSGADRSRGMPGSCGIMHSMSRAGTPTDNAAMESINGWIKSELFTDFHLQGENVVEEMAAYIKFFNEERGLGRRPKNHDHFRRSSIIYRSRNIQAVCPACGYG